PEQYIDKSYAGGGPRNVSDMGSAYQRMQRGFGYSDSQHTENKFGSAPAKKTNNRPEYLPPTPPSQKIITHIPSPNFEASDT
ncbi:hypothetical protein ABTE82_19550, partial [Acinetobacter baumannii]